MNAQRYMVHAPGKLMIAGEYAITEKGQTGIVAAIDRYLTVDIQPARGNRLDLPQLKLTDIHWTFEDGKVKFDKNDKRLVFIKHVLETVFAYIGDDVPIHLLITSELDSKSGQKYGLGSSAALSVGLVSALLQCSEKRDKAIDRELIFKLASIAHIKAQGNGSCADVAAATYGGWVHYGVFDHDWLKEQLSSDAAVGEIVEKEWPHLMIDALHELDDLQFLIGWTMKSAQTGPMVERVQALKESHPTDYQQFLQDSQEAVEEVVSGFKEKQIDSIFEGIRKNRKALNQIAEISDVTIETEGLTDLIEGVGGAGAGKTSGAGGGDCGIAFVKQSVKKDDVYDLWRDKGIEPLPFNAAKDGVTID
ncbi:phosphomevalonate kinase [Pelagirhabdus alkalitolerans]|uniref:phosphomevalonate kinase n=1 Tax=Pelagirhabdus alkalitolerans TaxID=1612202 RepID=A0A1G6JQ77_9BACI|nr:phosphomevalonate kinase [Pelagirhabdus alkalitolerans]SDC20879.1 phosphomevalonate kinase [Pelagirhabdus alkalitolerans]